MYNFIALMGEAGAGKDHIMREVLAVAPSLHEMISCTTRPQRQGEIHGVNYFYYTPEKFQQMINNGEMLEYTVFNNWFYGTSYESVIEGETALNIGVFNPEGIRALLKRGDCNVLVFWISARDKTRLMRQLNREEDPDVREVVRRFQADYNDFDNIEFEPIILVNETPSDIEANVKTILAWSERHFALGQE